MRDELQIFEAEEEEDERKNEAKRRADIDICVAIYQKNRELYPRQRDIDGLRGLVERAKASFIEGIGDLTGLSQESREHIVEKTQQFYLCPPLFKRRI